MRIAALLFVFAALVVTAGCGGAVRRPDGGVGLLPIGAMAPEVSGRKSIGGEVRLSSLRGRPVVVYFYPQDETPGCTKEACAFRDAWSELDRAGVAVIGVSVNSEERHRVFQKKYQLPFMLASDESGSVAASYGVPRRLWGFDRVTFLVGPDGRIAHVWPNVDPALHAREVVEQAARFAPPAS